MLVVVPPPHTTFCLHLQPNAEASSTDHSSATDCDSELFTSDYSSCCSGSKEDNEVQIVWATAAHGN